jgi:hypothetical protein
MIYSSAIPLTRRRTTMNQESAKCGECGGEITPKMDKCYRMVKGELKPVHRACQGGEK